VPVSNIPELSSAIPQLCRVNPTLEPVVGALAAPRLGEWRCVHPRWGCGGELGVPEFLEDDRRREKGWVVEPSHLRQLSRQRGPLVPLLPSRPSLHCGGRQWRKCGGRKRPLHAGLDTYQENAGTRTVCFLANARLQSRHTLRSSTLRSALPVLCHVYRSSGGRSHHGRSPHHRPAAVRARVHRPATRFCAAGAATRSPASTQAAESGAHQQSHTGGRTWRPSPPSVLSHGSDTLRAPAPPPPLRALVSPAPTSLHTSVRTVSAPTPRRGRTPSARAAPSVRGPTVASAAARCSVLAPLRSCRPTAVGRRRPTRAPRRVDAQWRLGHFPPRSWGEPVATH